MTHPLTHHLRTARVMLANYANHDTEEDAEYTRGIIEGIDRALAECERCAGTGVTGHRARTGSYVGPGPVPEDARGFVESTCTACRGRGVEIMTDRDIAAAIERLDWSHTSLQHQLAMSAAIACLRGSQEVHLENPVGEMRALLADLLRQPCQADPDGSNKLRDAAFLR